MTESDGNAGSDSAQHEPGTDATVNAASTVDPLAEAEVRSLLASLPSVTMPPEVAERITQALAAEPNPYAGVADGSATNVTSINSRAHRRNRWLVGAAGIAAVGVLGVVVGSTFWTDLEAPPTSAAVVPMSQSGTVYKKDGLATQVSQKLPAWHATNTASASAADSASASVTPSPNTASSSIATSSASADISPAEIAAGTRDQISKCLQRVDPRPPMHVDLAAYREIPRGPSEPVAVAVVRGDSSILDVYVLNMDCIGTIEDIVREHLTLAEPNH